MQRQKPCPQQCTMNGCCRFALRTHIFTNGHFVTHSLVSGGAPADAPTSVLRGRAGLSAEEEEVQWASAIIRNTKRVQRQI